MKACIAICGLDRSSRWTWHSMLDQVIRPAQAVCSDVGVICCLNSVDVVTNRRSRELGVRPEGILQDLPDCWFRSRVIVNQDDIDTSVLDELLPHCTDVYWDNFASYRNIFCMTDAQDRALHEIERLGYLDSDLFVMLRPDLFYLDPLPVAEIIERLGSDTDLLVPDWHSHHGHNDRFAVGNRLGAQCYLSRRVRLPEYLSIHGRLYSEAFLASCIDDAKLRLGRLPMLAVRVRATGAVNPLDKKLLASRNLQLPQMDERIDPTRHTPESNNGREGPMSQTDSQSTVPPRKLNVKQNTPMRVRAMFKGHTIASYLEIGVQFGKTFLAIDARHKQAVDPEFRFDTAAHATENVRFHQVPSNTYFANIWNGEKFDLIFLDGLHQCEQTLRDFCAALNASHDRTVIVIDDTVPVDAFSAQRNQHDAIRYRGLQGGTGSAWHGDVYKVVGFIQSFCPNLSYATIMNGGNPQTVVWKEARTNFRPYFRTLEEISRWTYFDLIDNLWVINPQTAGHVVQRVRNYLAAPLDTFLRSRGPAFRARAGARARAKPLARPQRSP